MDHHIDSKSLKLRTTTTTNHGFGGPGASRRFSHHSIFRVRTSWWLHPSFAHGEGGWNRHAFQEQKVVRVQHVTEHVDAELLTQVRRPVDSRDGLLSE